MIAALAGNVSCDGPYQHSLVVVRGDDAYMPGASSGKDVLATVKREQVPKIRSP